MPGPTHEVIVGVGGYLGHDANAAVIVDGDLIAAAQEERYTRRKHEGGFPALAAKDCLERARLEFEDVTDIVFAEKPVQTVLFDRTGKAGGAFRRWLGGKLPEKRGGLYVHAARRLFPHAEFHYAWHHLSHVAAAYHTSRFERAAFLCVDGKGEDCSASAGVIDAQGIRLRWEQPYANGLGLLYTLVTHHLGFASFGSEYKVMGLAPYGTPRYTEELGRLFRTDDRGGLRLNAAVAFAPAALAAAVPLVAAATGIPARGPHDPLGAVHADLAASLQRVFEEEIGKMARFLRTETWEKNLIFCGGCAQNCVAAGRLRAQNVFEEFYNSPVGGDLGSGLGAALLLRREREAGESFTIDWNGFYLGPDPGPSPAAAEPWRVHYRGALHGFVAEQLAAGKTVGWVRGRMELGARALGARSILADPRQPGMQSRLNRAVKFRESFRPFAPAILAEDAGDWFDSAAESNYMNYTANLRPERRREMPDSFPGMKERLDFPRSEIPSVIHVDFSARLQTVDRDVHPDFHELISAFKAKTGIPMVINTSFNVSGQPIVRTGQEAWDCFVNTDLDLLVVNNDVYRNPGERTREEKLAWLAQFSAHA